MDFVFIMCIDVNQWCNKSPLPDCSVTVPKKTRRKRKCKVTVALSECMGIHVRAHAPCVCARVCTCACIHTHKYEHILPTVKRQGRKSSVRERGVYKVLLLKAELFTALSYGYNGCQNSGICWILLLDKGVHILLLKGFNLKNNKGLKRLLNG